jgi:FAD/FMN-containing dehydrogenase
MVIDLSAMNGIRVDPERRVAKVEGGCTWGQLDHATHAFGLATPGGIISTTGVGGLTTGGGFGYLTRRYGLVGDNLISADVVTADGQLRLVNANQDADLFWAIRGGGSNFGIVTSFEFRLHPLSTVYMPGPFFTTGEGSRSVALVPRLHAHGAARSQCVFCFLDRAARTSVSRALAQQNRLPNPVRFDCRYIGRRSGNEAVA